MKNKIVKRVLVAGLSAIIAIGAIAGCGGKENPDAAGSAGGMEDDFAGKSAEFTWWILATDSNGEFYETYDENPVVQFINQQYWNVENGGIGTEETGRRLKISCLAPVAGLEGENYNTMIGTGDYPEIVDLGSSQESPLAMYENGILMEITLYVEKYMPNYLAYLDANPEMKPFVQVKDDEGKVHFYAIYSIMDGIKEPYAGICYRRDWVVKYAEPTEYVWDWEDDYVKENGHPAVTPLEKAIEEDNLKGWRKNEVTSFSADEGAEPNEDYTDNVIFPSGTENPLTVSDWEWMFEAFDTANVNQGKVGMWCGLLSTLGSTIRATCQDLADQKDAYVMGASYPINDVYGSEKQMYAEPDAIFQLSRRGFPVGITNKAQDKDLATLFTYLDWTYTQEGAKVIHLGLNEEQYESVELDPDMFAEYNIKSAYTESTDEDGKLVYVKTCSSSEPMSGALMGQRLNTGINLTGNDGTYRIEDGYSMVNTKAIEQFARYMDKGSVSDYVGLLMPDEAETYSKINTECMEYQSQNLPYVIQGKMSWEDYVKGFDTIDVDAVVSLLQKYVDLTKTSEQ